MLYFALLKPGWILDRFDLEGFVLKMIEIAFVFVEVGVEMIEKKSVGIVEVEMVEMVEVEVEISGIENETKIAGDDCQVV